MMTILVDSLVFNITWRHWHCNYALTHFITSKRATNSYIYSHLKHSKVSLLRQLDIETGPLNIKTTSTVKTLILLDHFVSVRRFSAMSM